MKVGWLSTVILLATIKDGSPLSASTPPRNRSKPTTTTNTAATPQGATSRRRFFGAATIGSLTPFAVGPFQYSDNDISWTPHFAAYAKTTTATQSSSSTNPRSRLIEAQETLDTLLTNYQRATIDCTYADVPRELLESKNKELLLEKASTFALFDKSVSVESCKTTNRIVRDYLGVTGKGPLVGIEKQIKLGIDFVEPDDLTDYISELESFSQSYSRATSLSYTAGVADFDAVNNFSKDEAKDVRNGNSNLEQTRVAIDEAKNSLDKMVSLLSK